MLSLNIKEGKKEGRKACVRFPEEQSSLINTLNPLTHGDKSALKK